MSERPPVSVRALGVLDTFLHRAWDWYINRTLPGWGRLQLWQWRLCNAYEIRYDRHAFLRRGSADEH